MSGGTSTADHAQVAEKWVQGLTGDLASLALLSHPEMRVWHSHDDQWLSREEGAARMADAGSAAAAPAFEDVRFTLTAAGFVLQGSIAGPGEAGPRMHIVQICTVRDGQIASCEEYIAPEMPLG